jgi:phage gp29-like protein
MLDLIKNLFSTAVTESAPRKFSGAMSPFHQRPSQTQNMDVDIVQGVIAQAQNGDITPLLGIYRDIETSDPTIQSAISTRKLAVLARGYSVIAADNSGVAGEKAADEVKAMLDRSPSFVDACSWLLHGCIWPVSVVNKRWVPGGPGGGFSHPEFRNVPLELLDYRTRCLRIRNVGDDGAPLADSHTPDDHKYIVHRGHMLMAPDTWGGPLRALVFWYLFSTQDREWWARFLERFGAPFLIGRYDKNDDDSRLNLMQAFSEATRLFGVVCTNETQIELKEAASASNSSTAFKDFHEVAKDEKLLLILGQTLSGSAKSTGLGSGTATLQSKVRDDVKLWDAFKLSNTVKTSIIVPFMRANGIQGPAPSITFGGFDPEVLAAAGPFIEALAKAGLDVDDDGLSTISRHLGITLVRKPTQAPQPGEAVLSLLAALPQSTMANEAISRDVAADLARAFSGDLAPLGEILKSSRNTAELLSRSGAFLARFRSPRAHELITAALESHAANALVK